MCDVCMTDNIAKHASVWCSECEEAMCKDCERQHGRMGLTKYHNTIPIEDYQKLLCSVAAIKQTCTDHSLKFDFYCEIHNAPCCVSCVTEAHCTCQKLKPLSEVAGGVKSSAAFVDLEDRTKDISALVGDLISEKQNNRASFGLQKSKIIFEVQNVRRTINNHLVKLEKDLFDKLDIIEKTQNSKSDNFIEKLSEMRQKIENICRDLEKTKQYASNVQVFLGIHEWNKKLEIEEKEWMSFQSDQLKDTVDIQLQFLPILMQFDLVVKELGKLDVNFSSSKKIRLQKEKQGQILVPISNTVDNIKLAKFSSFRTPCAASGDIMITGIDLFDDGRIVLADQSLNKRLVIINQEGKLIKTIQLGDQCYDVAVIDKDTVATTLFLKNNIVIIDVSSSKVQRSIPTSDKCGGISYTGEQLIVSLVKHYIHFFDLSGNILSTMSTVGYSNHCSMFADKLYYTKHNSNAVYSKTLNGEFRWKYDFPKLTYPIGITNDASGNIFVTCRDSHQLLLLGQDGKKSRILLTKENGLNYPRAICYDRNSNILLVCNLSGQCFLYKVTN